MRPTAEDDAFGHWLAGFFAGEGTLGIYPYYRYDGYRCNAKIGLRMDDRPILEEIARWTGIGHVYEDKKGAGAERNPCAAWAVNNRKGCSALVDIFTAYPLRAKKAQDFAIWAPAVREWCSTASGRTRDWERMESLYLQLRGARVFAADCAEVADPAEALVLFG